MFDSLYEPLRIILGKIRSVILVAITLGLFSVSSHGQGARILEESLPSVYIAYEASSNRASKNGTILFRLHNNTNMSINVSANFGIESASTIEDGSFELPNGGRGTLLKSGSEVELCYDAEGLFLQKGYSVPRKSPDPAITNLRFSCSYRSNGKRVDDPYSMGYWIRPKEFVRFRVPASLLREGSKIYTEFRYPWEFANGRVRLNEPKHRVYFFYFDIPDEK